MSNLVRVRVNGLLFNVGRAFAEAQDLDVTDESAHTRDGQRKPTMRENGRKRKPKTSVAQAAEKKAAESADKSDNTPSKEN